MFAIRVERGYVIEEDFMKAARKIMDQEGGRQARVREGVADTRAHCCMRTAARRALYKRIIDAALARTLHDEGRGKRRVVKQLQRSGPCATHSVL